MKTFDKCWTNFVFATVISFQVGAEKEMNFLDLFKEVSYLLPKDIKVRFSKVLHTCTLVAFKPF